MLGALGSSDGAQAPSKFDFENPDEPQFSDVAPGDDADDWQKKLDAIIQGFGPLSPLARPITTQPAAGG